MKTLTEVAREAEAIYARYTEAAAYDRGFDGGEFSAPAHGRACEREIDALAEAHHISREELDAELLRRAIEEGE